MNTRVIFTLLVLITLPLAGCIEGSDVAGSLQTGGDSSDDSTTYTNQTTYVNETTIVQQTLVNPQPEIFIRSGFGGECSTWENSSDGSSRCTQQTNAERYEIDMLRVPANTSVEVLSGTNYNAGTYNFLYLNIRCESGWSVENFVLGSTYTQTHIPTDGSGCDVTNSQEFHGHWSMTYVLHNATVVAA